MNKAAELWPGGPIMQQEPGAPLGTDTVLLGAFARPAGAARCIDLGCGAGALSRSLRSCDGMRRENRFRRVTPLMSAMVRPSSSS